MRSSQSQRRAAGQPGAPAKTGLESAGLAMALHPGSTRDAVLKAGENSLLVEVSQTFGMWGLYLRFEDEAGQPLRLTDEGSLEPIGGEP